MTPIRKWFLLLAGAALVALPITLLTRAATLVSYQIHGVKATAGIDASRMPERLAGLIRFRTISYEDPAKSDPAEFDRLHNYLQETWPKLHQTLARETVANLSLLYKWEGTDLALPPVILMAHQDVVPVEPGTESAWQHPPFSGDLVAGQIWGRGAVDDKLALAGILEAVERLLEQGYRPKRTVYLAFGHDEETKGSGAQAMADLLKSRGVRPVAVFDEGGAVTQGLAPGVAVDAALVAIAEKGHADFELVATARGGHSSAPPPHTSIGFLALAIAAIENHPFPARITAPEARTFQYLAPEADLGIKLVLANRWLLEGPLLKTMTSTTTGNASVRTVCSANIISGGEKSNVLPQTARAVVNCRLLPGDTAQQIASRFRELIHDDHVQVRVLSGEPASAAAIAGSLGEQAIQKAIAQIWPDAIFLPSLSIGATDARHFGSLTPNIYRFAPFHLNSETLKQMHGAGERVSEEDAKNAARFYAQLLLDLE